MQNFNHRSLFFFFNLSFLFLIFPFLAQALTTEEIIQKVQSTYENAQDVSSDFVQQVTIASLERQIEKTGKTLFKKPGKFRVEYTGEEARLYVSDGKKLWMYDPGDKQVQVYEVSAKTIPEETLSFLGGLGNLKKQFQVSGLNATERKKIKANETLDWLLLIPKNPESTLDELLLGFDRTRYTITEAYLKNDSGNVSHYFFKNVTLNSGVKDSEFVFVKPKGVKEIKN